MPSSIGHASVAVLLSPAIWNQPRPRRLMSLAAVAAALPDVDAIGRPLGLHDLAFLGGHRALTYSWMFALIAGATVAAVWQGRAARRPLQPRVVLFAVLVVMSHGVLDSMSTYGEGVELFAPFSSVRREATWQPFAGITPEGLFLWVPAVAIGWLFARRERGAANVVADAA